MEGKFNFVDGTYTELYNNLTGYHETINVCQREIFNDNLGARLLVSDINNPTVVFIDEATNIEQLDKFIKLHYESTMKYWYGHYSGYYSKTLRGDIKAKINDIYYFDNTVEQMIVEDFGFLPTKLLPK